MLNKRRRASSVASRQEDDIADDSTPESSPIIRKKKKLDPTELCQQLYDSIRNFKKEDGTMLCDTFIRAPKRRQEPSYYEKVEHPIDLLRIQQKLKTDSYDDIEELTCDLELLISNAKAFYKPESNEYQDACSLWDIYNTNKIKLLESFGLINDENSSRSKRIPRQPRRSTAQESETSEASEDADLLSKLEELFSAIMTATDPLDDSRSLHIEFQLLPSKKIYPEYYYVVEHPIDLKLIATKIQTNAYSNIYEMEKDILQMIKNACIFNEPKSQIYNDAKALKRIFNAKKIDIESGKVKLSSVKKRGFYSYSKEIASIKDEPESSDDDDDRNEKNGEGPMWQLFDHLYNAASATDHPNITGAPLGHSLWKLPHRRFRSDYYEIIKKPISMSQIQSKLKKGEYSTISDLTSDLYLMIDNAKKAYPPTNRIHKDAVKMLKIMNAKLVDNESEAESEEETDDEDDEALITLHKSGSPIPKKKGRPRLNPVVTPTGSNQSLSPKSRTPGITTMLKKKLLSLQKYLVDYAIDNRKPMALFMEKPSKKLYSDYYDIIVHPIDMNTIENNIRNDKYGMIDDVVGDYRLMFSNCRKYNEEGSRIYEDANILEKALNEKLKEFSNFINKHGVTPRILLKPGRKESVLDNKLWQLYDKIREYHEPKANRQLSFIFMKLPSQKDYPDYYDIIKNPIDMDKIDQKLKKQHYESIDELAADFTLMFENACKYNEPDSQIYKDALVLQQICIQTKQSLRDNDEVPDVPLAVQELLLSLFTSLYNHQDEEGRCFSDSLAELPEYDEADGQKVRGISLDLIKRRLDKGAYKRLDTFQEDIFSCFDRARKLSRTDSQVFEDSIELQSYFIKKREELCKDILSSPAMSYNNLHLSAAVEAVRQSKLLQEEQDQDQEQDMAATHGESMTIDQKVFSPGDFVYYNDSPENKVPSIAYIERLWTNAENVKMMFANIFLRPFETYHVTTRKFLEQEVFKSDKKEAITMDKVSNKCYVMSVKDYIKYKPEGFADKDVYVCESRYNSRARSFKKIKNWALVRDNDPVKFVPRETTLELKRVMSVFKERVEKHKGELAELQLQEALVEKEKLNIACLVTGGEEGSTYYEQFNTVCSGVVKTGDYVYVATQSGKQSIVQIHSIWENAERKSYFQGPWLLTPAELPTPINKVCYRQELFLSTAQDPNPTIAIVGRCAVLDYNEFTTRRPTEIAESDVFICEYIYDEVKKTVTKIQPSNSLKKFTHTQMVTPDEIFHFKRPIKLFKNFKKESTDDFDLEDSLDGNPPSINSDMLASSPAPSIISTPASKRSKSNKSSKVTGYILYSSEHRKGLCASNPNSSFGDISRMVGNEWKNLPPDTKQMWEDKASKINEENAKLFLEEQSCASPTPEASLIHECLWNKCNYQFEDINDCVEHCVAEGTGHIFETYGNKTDPEYHCLWKNCIRMKKQMSAFPHMQRLVKHVRDIHVMKGGRNLNASNRSRNYFPRKTPVHVVQPPLMQDVNPTSPQQILFPPQPQAIQIPPPEPIFITVPPKPQRVLHSEAYIRYIEGLQNNSGTVYSWEKTLKASPKTTPPVDMNKLPSHWLGNTDGKTSEEVVNALWHLRDFMMRDVYEINQNCY